MVVLAHENNRQLPDGSEIHALVDSALSGRAVPEEADADGAISLEFGAERRAHGQRYPSPNDTVRPKHSFCEICNVHRTALTFAKTGVLAKYLGHHPGRIDPFCDAVAVASVGTAYPVGIGEMGANPCRTGLFAVRCVGDTHRFTQHRLLQQHLFKPPYAVHGGVDPAQLFGSDLHRRLRPHRHPKRFREGQYGYCLLSGNS